MSVIAPSCTHGVPTGNARAEALSPLRRLTRRAGGYCVDCRPPYSRGKQRSGGKQQTFRRKTLQTYGLRCMACGHPGSPDNPIEAA